MLDQPRENCYEPIHFILNRCLLVLLVVIAGVGAGAYAKTPQDQADSPKGLFYKWIRQVADSSVPEPNGEVLIFRDSFEAITGSFVTSADYPVIAHGGQLVLTGLNFTGATEVIIGGVSHTNLIVGNDTTLTVTSISDSVPTGTQNLVVLATAGTSPAFNLTVIHLILNEVEIDTPASDNHEFIEISTGVANLSSLEGYVVVLFNGGFVNGDRYQIFDLGSGGPATSDGLMLIGGAVLTSTPQILINDLGFIQNGEDAIAIYQFSGDAATFPVDYTSIGNTGLIDALVYESNGDTDRTQLYPLLTDGLVVDEGLTTAARETVSIQRCDNTFARRAGGSFSTEVPTPGLPNVPCGMVAALPTCTIDFSICPNDGAGQCGALFVAHGGVELCHNIGVSACDGGAEALQTFATDERIDIYLMGEVNSLSTFLAPYLGTPAVMRFFDVNGNEVGSQLSVATDCNVSNPPASNTADLGVGAVRRIQVTGFADIWIDDFQINP